MNNIGYMILESAWLDVYDNIENYHRFYYNIDTKKWITSKDIKDGDMYFSCIPCKTLKAARRHIRKHDEIPVGTKFILVSKYIGVPDVILTKH